jgi:uncharacterized protein (TIGR00730 family)
MIDHADAFIALPGGYGTLDEVIEVLSLTYLDLSDKPLILLNAENFWSSLVDLVAAMHRAGFADRSPGTLLHTADSPAGALALAERVAGHSRAYAAVEALS